LEELNDFRMENARATTRGYEESRHLHRSDIRKHKWNEYDLAKKALKLNEA
jgi:hypothetical protein